MLEEKERLQSEVSSWETTLVHLQKSLEKDECKLLDLGKSRDNVHQEFYVWQAKCKDYDPTTLEKHRVVVSTTIAF
jgi:hypothetical protein